MNGTTINNNIPSFGFKQYIVNGTDGPAVVRVAFDSHSSATLSAPSSTGSGVLINIGTKNLSTNADLTQAISSAVSSASSVNINDIVKSSAENILKNADEAIKAASTNVPNEDVVGLLM